MQFFSIYDSTSTGLISFGLCSTSVFTTEKKLCISGPGELKSIVFKGQCVCARARAHTHTHKYKDTLVMDVLCLL